MDLCRAVLVVSLCGVYLMSCDVVDQDGIELESRLSETRWNCRTSRNDNTLETLVQEFRAENKGVADITPFVWSVIDSRSLEITLQEANPVREEVYLLTDVSFTTVHTENDNFQALDSRNGAKLSCMESGWGFAELLDTDEFNPLGLGLVATDAEGNQMLVWPQSDETSSRIWWRYKAVGSSWSVARQIELESSADLSVQAIIFDSDGDATGIWGARTATSNQFWSSHFTKNDGWSSAGKMPNNEDGYALSFSQGPTGSIVIIWSSFDGMKSTGVWASRYELDVGWGPPELIIDNPGEGRIYRPQIVADIDGNAAAVWAQSIGGAVGIWSSLYTAGVGWGVANRLSDNDVIASHVNLAVDGAGNAQAAWSEVNGTGSGVWSSRYNKNGIWDTPELVATENTTFATFPIIKINAAGDAVVIWTLPETTGVRFILKANRFTPGSGWGAVETLQRELYSVSSHRQPAIDAAGNALVLWQSYGGLRTSRYVVGRGWGASERITNYGSHLDSGSLSIDLNGDARAVMRKYDGRGNRNIWVSESNF